MIADLVESLAGIAEFIIEAASITGWRRIHGPRVGTRVRAGHAVNAPAVLRPLTPTSDRLEVCVPPGSLWRVELALPGNEQPVYLACLDPLHALGLSAPDERLALARGLWLEVPRSTFASTFRPL